MTASRSCVLLALAAAGLLILPVALAAGPTPTSNYWFSRINATHLQPTGMTVVVVPSAYASKSANVDDRDWITANLLRDQPGVRATVEAIEYWAWMIDQYESTYPQLKRLTFTAKILGVDATQADLQTADIVVNTAAVTDPVPFVFHLGVGLPTLGPQALSESVVRFVGQPMSGQTLCTVWNTGLGQEDGDQSPTRLRNLVIHEFGHCIGAGHTGESLDQPHCNDDDQCYDNHPSDVMSLVVGDERQCLSNLNVLSLAEGYAWATTPTATWQPHDEEVYQAKSAYAVRCMPASLEKY